MAPLVGTKLARVVNMLADEGQAHAAAHIIAAAAKEAEMLVADYLAAHLKAKAAKLAGDSDWDDAPGDWIIVEVYVVAVTEKAVLVFHDPHDDQHWLPKTQIKLAMDDWRSLRAGVTVTMKMSRWIAAKKDILDWAE